MKTKSAWGNPPSRIFRFIKKIEKEFDREISVCVIGCSDGKFIFPFVRRKMLVTGYEIDPVAIHGGEKIFPVSNTDNKKEHYIPNMSKQVFPDIPSEKRQILGLKKRLQLEKLEQFVRVKVEDFYKSISEENYDIVFTSCSIQYKSNIDVGIDSILKKLKKSVKIGGYLYMDYMMPLEDCHIWKSELFLRTNQLKNYFDNNWNIIYIKESKFPIMELAHVDRPANHFHRFGYVLVKRVHND